MDSCGVGAEVFEGGVGAGAAEVVLVLEVARGGEGEASGRLREVSVTMVLGDTVGAYGYVETDAQDAMEIGHGSGGAGAGGVFAIQGSAGGCAAAAGVGRDCVRESAAVPWGDAEGFEAGGASAGVSGLCGRDGV